ncbi:hypothetical protein FLM55_09165 [Francisella sp. Scap27]|uniref:NAD(P)-binding domain-containing protein n=1 Tax=Francisella sp. Scap27 TaxID=2589986 RepID=UPI0015BADC66|nr:NAD(P)-binding domain-containing protein [Francisella sp. Scap27]QLE79891.1 hypothetical protein FLM55_09165 [Francisella sp. Scap27]
MQYRELVMTKHVAIIGAGASGIICAKKFLDAGFNVTIFEKSDNTAGVWNFSDSGVVYDSLRTNLPKEIMAFEDQLVPYGGEESFPGYAEVRDYLANNSNAWGVDKIIKFECEVIDTVPIEKDNHLTKWKLFYKDGVSEKSEEFDYIATCNGHYETPNFPDDVFIEADTKEHVSHSKSYRAPTSFGARILCVGYSSSGNDIARDLLESGREVFVSQKIIDETSEKQNLANVEGIRFVSQIKSIKKVGDECIAETQFGSTIKFDNVIFCTGYKYSFPFLNDEIISTKNNMVKPLYSELIHEKYYSLAFVGLPWKTLPFVLAESQAIFLSKAWVDDSIIKLVNHLEISQDHYTRIKRESLSGKYYHCLGDKQWSYDKKLLSLVGELSQYRINRVDAIEEVFTVVAIAKAKDLQSYRDKNYSFDKLKKFSR